MFIVSIISSISGSLAIMLDTITVGSMVVRTALVDKRAGMTIITWLSRSLAISIISMSISIPAIVSMESLWTSMSITDSMTIPISWLSICRPLTIDIAMSIVSMETLWTSMCITMISIGMECNTTISIARLCFSLAIAIVSMVSSKTLCSSICVTMASIRMVGSTIARLSSSKAGKSYNNRYNFNCHGYECTKL